MTNNIGNWTIEACSTVGTGDLTLTGSGLGYITFKQAVPAGTVYYSITDGVNKEAGRGTFDGEQTLVRTDVDATLKDGLYNNVNPTPLNLSGNAQVACTLNAHAYDAMALDADKYDKAGGQISGDVLILDATPNLIVQNAITAGEALLQVLSAAGAVGLKMAYSASTGETYLERTGGARMALKPNGNIQCATADPADDDDLITKKYAEDNFLAEAANVITKSLTVNPSGPSEAFLKAYNTLAGFNLKADGSTGAIFLTKTDSNGLDDGHALSVDSSHNVKLMHNSTVKVDINAAVNYLMQNTEIFGDLTTSGTVTAANYVANGNLGANGTFTTTDGKTVTVTEGLITGIV